MSSSHPPMLCQTGQLVASTLKETPEAAFLLNADGVVLYENPQGKKLLFETTDQHFDIQAGNPSHHYHFSFFWTFSSPNKPWQDFFDEIVYAETKSTACLQKRRRSFEDDDASLREEYDVICKRTNGTEFPASLRLTKVGECPCPCCQEAGTVYLCAYVKAKGDAADGANQYGGMIKNRSQNPFEKNDHHLKGILNASFDPVFVIDEHGSILLVNKAAVAMFGWTEEELVGDDVSKICGGDHGPKHHEYIRNYIDTGVAKIIGKKREVPARRKDGSEFPVELGVHEVSGDDYGIPGKAVFCAFLKDLSSQKKHEYELKHKMELMQGMINASFDPMFQINEKGVIQVVNDAAVALFGYRRMEMIGSNISLICGGGHAESHHQYLERYLKDGHKRIIGRKRQVTARRKDGKEFEIELGVQEVVSDTGEKLFCGFMRDLTQQLLEKRRMSKHEAVMKGKFFGTDENG